MRQPLRRAKGDHEGYPLPANTETTDNTTPKNSCDQPPAGRHGTSNPKLGAERLSEPQPCLNQSDQSARNRRQKFGNESQGRQLRCCAPPREPRLWGVQTWTAVRSK